MRRRRKHSKVPPQAAPPPSLIKERQERAVEAAKTSPRQTARSRWIIVTAGGLVVAAVLAYIFWPKSGPREDPDLGDDVVEDPRLTYATPFRNVRPEVKYVGDAACVGCHREIHHTFHQHSMGRSLASIEQIAPGQRYEAAAHNPFEAQGRDYAVERQGDLAVHVEIRKDAHGRTVTESRETINYAIGSGAHAHSYLFTRGEHLFQSPITWYSDPHKPRWDLSPGYESYEDRFERAVRPECLFCHTNYVEPVKGTLNRYETPLFPRGMAIGCERCHGPGDLHVSERRQRLPIPAGGVDHSIVNPRHLEPALREAVCQQCHLEGGRRILRRGREPFDFRPGMPLHLFWSIYVSAPELSEHGTFVGQVEQMHASRCFTASKGEMGCITCHDPHALPSGEKKTAYYRQHCVDCHLEKSCSVALAERQTKNQDNCVACHMPRKTSADISHTAITDHRILRRPESSPAHPTPRPLRPGEVPLVHFHKDQLKPGDPEAQRDLGLALVDMAKQPTPVSRQIGQTALPYLDAALKRGPRDSAALEAKAFILDQLGQPKAALELVEKVLARSPQHETALAGAAMYAERARELPKALDYSRRAVAVNPWHTPRRARYIGLLIQHREFDQAVRECHAVLAFNPGSIRIRTLLISAYLRMGRKNEAQREFDTIVRLNPPDIDKLRQWYAERSR